MTREEYMELNKELASLLGEDLFKQRMDAERDELTARQYEYIYALEARIAELEAKLETHDYAIREAADFLSKLSEDCPPDMYNSYSEYCKKCLDWKPAHRCGCWERKLITGGSDA